MESVVYDVTVEYVQSGVKAEIRVCNPANYEALRQVECDLPAEINQALRNWLDIGSLMINRPVVHHGGGPHCGCAEMR